MHGFRQILTLNYQNASTYDGYCTQVEPTRTVLTLSLSCLLHYSTDEIIWDVVRVIIKRKFAKGLMVTLVQFFSSYFPLADGSQSLTPSHLSASGMQSPLFRQRNISAAHGAPRGSDIPPTIAEIRVNMNN